MMCWRGYVKNWPKVSNDVVNNNSEREDKNVKESLIICSTK